jgi:hypothetical protein
MDNQLERIGKGETMEPASVRVLVVDETVSDVSHVVAYLRTLDCQCTLSRSFEGACALFPREQFDLVLSNFVLPGGDCHKLSSLLMGRQVSLFYFYAVEGGCWWIPRIRHGEECRGEAALRPSEFARVLRELITDVRTSGTSIRARRRSTADPHPTSF